MLADDHPAALLGLRQTLALEPSLTIVGEANDARQLFAALEARRCDVLVSDYAMPGEEPDGLAMFHHIRRYAPALPIVVHTMMDNPAVARLLLHEGIGCLLSKADSTKHLVPAIHAAYGGGSYVSPEMAKLLDVPPGPVQGRWRIAEWTEREEQIIRYYITGQSVNEIADTLHRTKQTVSTQKSTAMAKLGMRHDIDLIRYTIETARLEPRTLADERSADACDGKWGEAAGGTG
ncbi:hypothetical protein WJ74_24200 [Burkholderia ubonensis]|nr:hypothetical protein WJ74_24200 [Burkholderia ubonensis]